MPVLSEVDTFIIRRPDGRMVWITGSGQWKVKIFIGIASGLGYGKTEAAATAEAMQNLGGRAYRSFTAYPIRPATVEEVGYGQLV